MTKRKLGNKGLSLLELLIGITMLAIIVVPVLHAMLTSSTTSSKAKEVRNQTVAAQNILESYEATDIGTIIQTIKEHGTPFGSIADTVTVYAINEEDQYSAVTSDSAEETHGSAYKVYMEDVWTDYKTYDAVVTLDAAVYQDRNSVGIVDYKPMDAVYIQPAPTDESNPDVIAARDFASRGIIDTGLNVSYIQFLDGSNPMTRKVTITIQKIGDQAGIISCTAKFEYSVTKILAVDDSEPPVMSEVPVTYSTTVNSDFYSGSYTDDNNGIYGLYFFFYPNVHSDTIEVVNSKNIAMSIYLVRQSSDNATYAPTIKLMEKASQTNTPNAQMYYNNFQNQTQTYSYHVGYPDGTDSLRYIWRRTYIFDGTLIGTPAHNRLYGVSVEIYKADSIQEDGSILGMPLAVFDASSLE